MEVHLTPELEKKLNSPGRAERTAPGELVRDAVAGLVNELAGTREMLDRRYDDLKSGRVKPINREAFFERLRQREDELMSSHTP